MGLAHSVIEYSVHVIKEIGKPLLVALPKKAITYLRSRRERHEIATNVKKLLGIRDHQNVAYRHDSVHPHFSEHSLHPDNLDAVRYAAGSEIYRAKELGRIRTADRVVAAIEENMVLLGSPAAEGVSRLVFGYIENAKDHLVLKEPPLDLPYSWQLDADKLRGARIKRYVRDLGIMERPNWHIVRNASKEQRRYIPETDREGFLQTDYLLVTRIRNFLTPTALNNGKYIISFGGAHGTATRSVDLLLNQNEMLLEISRRLDKSAESFQLLFRVYDMKHDKRSGTRARKIELLDTILLPDNPSTWDFAALNVAPKAEIWMSPSPHL